MASPPAILGITKRFAWLVLPADSMVTDRESSAVSIVSIQRLMELGSRLREVTDIDRCSADHLLLRFNVLNLSDGSVRVCAIGLLSALQEPLRCEVAPSVAIGPGARYPFAVEVRSKLESAAVEVQLQLEANDRPWVSVIDLPH